MTPSTRNCQRCGHPDHWHRHDDCLSTAGRIHDRKTIAEAEQGFMTSRNRFVSRYEGAAIQRAAGIDSATTKRPVEGMLFSEDLYLRDWREPLPAPPIPTATPAPVGADTPAEL